MAIAGGVHRLMQVIRREISPQRRVAETTVGIAASNRPRNLAGQRCASLRVTASVLWYVTARHSRLVVGSTYVVVESTSLRCLAGTATVGFHFNERDMAVRVIA